MSDLDVRGQAIVVTGAGRGLGREMALALARAGANVVAAARGRDDLESLREEIKAAGTRCLVAPTDVTDSSQVEALTSAAVEAFGRVHTWINNAGGVVTDLDASLLELSDADWQAELDLNLNAAFYGARAILPHFLEEGGGLIVNVGSVGGRVAVAGITPYGVAKAGLLQLTRSLALTYARDGVRALSLVIGNFPHAYPAEVGAQQARFMPMGRNGNDEEVGPLVVYLCSPAAAYLSGSEVVFDGGWSVGGPLPAGSRPGGGDA